jgi:hypothetical protein
MATAEQDRIRARGNKTGTRKGNKKGKYGHGIEEMGERREEEKMFESKNKKKGRKPGISAVNVTSKIIERKYHIFAFRQ